MLAKMARRPALILPGDVHVQPVDSDEFADVVLAALVDEHRPAGSSKTRRAPRL
jgi:hypothetical protein